MAWQRKVPISKEMYASSWPVICFYRMVTYFPFVVHRQKSSLFLKWSPLCALYSFAVGGFLVFRALWELYQSYLAGGYNGWNLSPTDKLAIVFAHGGWIIMSFCGTFVIPSRVTKFLSYLECINEVDEITKPTYSNMEKYSSVCIMLIPPTLAFMYCANNFRSLRSMGFTVSKFFEFTGGFYVLYVICVSVFYIIRQMVHSLEKRVNALNKHLETTDLHLKRERTLTIGKEKGFSRGFLKVDVLKHVLTVSQTVADKLEKKPKKQSGSSQINFKDDYNIPELTRAYLKLCDAAVLLNSIFGETITIGIVVAFVQVVQPLYFMIQALMIADNRTIFSVIGSSVSVMRNLLCGLLIIESSYACLTQVKATEKYVCRLLSYKTNSRMRKQLKRFAVCLGLRQMRITGCGLFQVDRFLFTAMIECAVTFMLLLLQMQENDTKK